MSLTVNYVVFYFNIMFTNSEEKNSHSSNLLVIHILITLNRTTILHFKEHDIISRFITYLVKIKAFLYD